MKNNCEFFPPVSDEQHLMLQSVERIADEVVAPRAAEIDQSGEFPWDIHKVFAETGLFRLPIAEEYGGLGEGLFMTALVIEEIARACFSSAMIVGATALATYPMELLATPEQKQKYFPKMASGEFVPCVAYSEPDAGSDLASLRTKAVRQNDCWVINGQKRWVSEAPVADIIILFARTDAASTGPNGISIFILEKNSEGLSVGKPEDKIGARASLTADLYLDNVRVPLDSIMGEEGRGFITAMNSLEKERIVCGALALGCSCGAIEYAVQYANERKQFGRRIGEFQGLQFMLADMKTKYEASRALLIQAAQKTDNGSGDCSIFSSMAKYFASEVAMEVTTNAVQVLGGYGVSREYPVERLMRDAKITQIFGGTSQIQQWIIARRMLGL